MPRTIIKTEQPVVLDGFQAVLKPSKFGYSLSTVLDQDMIDLLEDYVINADEDDTGEEVNDDHDVDEITDPRWDALKGLRNNED